MNTNDSDTKVDREQVMKTTGRSQPHHAEHDSAPGDASASEIVDAIQRAKTADSVDDLWTSDMLLPGFGTTRDSCGNDFPRFCSDCGSITMWRRTCYQSMCPECGKSWARRTSKRVCAKLEAIRRYREVSLERHQRFHHAVVSPPADWDPAAEEPWKRAKDVVKEILDAANMWGFVVYHPYKGKNGDDRGKWKKRQFHGRDWDDVKEELKFAPHFHVIGVGHEFPGGDVTRDVESETGWILHRITKEGTNVSLYDEFDLARAVTYCLSHAGVDVADDEDDQDEVATRWTGTKFTESGKTANDVTASDGLEREMDAVVRAVAPKTLNLEYNALACSSEYVDEDAIPGRSDEKVEVAAAEASLVRGQSYAPGVGASASSSTSTDEPEPMERSASELPDVSGSGVTGEDGADAGAESDYVDDLVEVAKADLETERCNGRLLGIGKAARFLDDDEWRRRARHADDLEDAYEEWSERLDWLGS